MALTPREQRIVEASNRILHFERALAIAQEELKTLLSQNDMFSQAEATGTKARGTVIKAEPPISTAESILALFEKHGKDAKLKNPYIIKALAPIKPNNVRSGLSALKKRALIRQVRRGVWSLPPSPKDIKEGGNIPPNPTAATG